MGSGVAVFDYDNDGLLDLFFVNGAPLGDPMAKDAIPENVHRRIGIGYTTSAKTEVSRT